MSRCTCTHSRRVHRNSRGRCTVRGCTCLFAPPPVRAPEPQARGTVTVDASGVVLDYRPPESPRPHAARDRLEKMLWRKIEEAGLPLPDQLEYRWARSEGRQYRADGFYRPNWLIEVDGGIWAPDPGRHNRGSGFEADHARDNLAVLLGFRILRFTERMIRDGTAVQTIRRALCPEQTTHQPALMGGRVSDAS